MHSVFIQSLNACDYLNSFHSFCNSVPSKRGSIQILQGVNLIMKFIRIFHQNWSLQQKNGVFQVISSFTLHIIAMILMLCDHLWATVLSQYAWLTCPLIRKENELVYQWGNPVYFIFCYGFPIGFGISVQYQFGIRHQIIVEFVINSENPVEEWNWKTPTQTIAMKRKF